MPKTQNGKTIPKISPANPGGAVNQIQQLMMTSASLFFSFLFFSSSFVFFSSLRRFLHPLIRSRRKNFFSSIFADPFVFDLTAMKLLQTFVQSEIFRSIRGKKEKEMKRLSEKLFSLMTFHEQGGMVMCQLKDCPKVDCDNPIRTKDDCCPMCPGTPTTT